MVNVSLNKLVQIVKKGQYLVLDVETTGFDPAEVLQIGVLYASGETAMDTLLKPISPITPQASKVHGITAKDVAGAQQFADIWETLRVLLQDQPVLIYNAQFDLGALQTTHLLHGLQHIPWAVQTWYQCVMYAFAEHYGDWSPYYKSYRWKPLHVAMQHFGIEQNKAYHGAIADCHYTLEVAKALARAY